jgi:hypothetical protein
VYKQSASTSNVIVGKEYLALLENRLKVVEDSLAAVKAEQARSQRRIRFDDEETELTNQPDAVHGTGLSSQPGSGVDSDDDQSHDSPDIIDETDGMGAVTFSAEEYCGFFGDNVISSQFLTRLIVSKVHLQISPSPVTYPGRSHGFLMSLNRLSLQTILRTTDFSLIVVL